MKIVRQPRKLRDPRTWFNRKPSTLDAARSGATTGVPSRARPDQATRGGGYDVDDAMGEIGFDSHGHLQVGTNRFQGIDLTTGELDFRLAPGVYVENEDLAEGLVAGAELVKEGAEKVEGLGEEGASALMEGVTAVLDAISNMSNDGS